MNRWIPRPGSGITVWWERRSATSSTPGGRQVSIGERSTLVSPNVTILCQMQIWVNWKNVVFCNITDFPVLLFITGRNFMFDIYCYFCYFKGDYRFCIYRYLFLCSAYCDIIWIVWGFSVLIRFIISSSNKVMYYQTFLRSVSRHWLKIVFSTFSYTVTDQICLVVLIFYDIMSYEIKN